MSAPRDSSDAPDRTNALRGPAEAIDRFVATIDALPHNVFLAPMNGWAPRDVVAHLIGWNRLTVDGAREILHGRAPAYLDDVDNGFRRVNADAVRAHSSTDRDTLLDELTESAREAAAFVRALKPSSWTTSIRFREWTISVADCVDALRQDYDTHRERIAAWASAQFRSKETQ